MTVQQTKLLPHPDDPVYLTSAEVAARFRTTEASVRRWRHEGSGPRGTRFGRRVLYALPDVEVWEAAVIAAEHGVVQPAASRAVRRRERSA